MLGNEFENIVVPATRGIQAGREYYIAMFRIKAAAQLFKVDYYNLPPEQRSQRIPDAKRIEEIKTWILSDPAGYILPALTGSVAGKMVFQPWDQCVKLGLLSISADAEWFLLDGQHRNESLRQVVSVDPKLQNETIAVTLFQDQGLEWRQNSFSRINATPKLPTTSLVTFYGNNPEMNFTRSVLEKVPYLLDYTEKEKTSLSGKDNEKLFVYAWMNNALNKEMRSGGKEEEEKQFAIAFWTSLLDVIQPWQDVFNEKETANYVRDYCVCSYAVTIRALARLGKALKDTPKEDLASILLPLRAMRWQKTDPEFQGRIVYDEKMLTKTENINLLVIYLKKRLAIALTEQETRLEASHQ